MSGLGQLLKLPPALEGEAARAEGNDREPPAARLRAAGDRLERAVADLRDLLGGGDRPAGEWAAALDAALFGPGALVRAAVEGYESLEVETAALRADLDAMRAIDEQLGGTSLTLEAFAAELEVSSRPSPARPHRMARTAYPTGLSAEPCRAMQHRPSA